MNREEFIRQLERLLINIPENDRLDAIAYYNDYFDDAGVENEQQVILELGSPEKVAEKIKEELDTTRYADAKDYLEPKTNVNSQKTNNSQNYNHTQGNTSSYTYENYTTAPNYHSEEKKKPNWALIILIIVTFPLWIGVVAGLFGGCMGLLGALIGVVFALFGSGIGLFFGGLGTMVAGFCAIATPIEAVATIGVGAILSAVGLLLLLLFAWITIQWIPLLVKAVISLIKRLFHKEEGGNEI